MKSNIIELRALKKIYRIGKIDVTALDGISLDIAQKDFVAIMGPSGSGKSTMMNILGCLDKPSNGQYRLEGREVGNMSDDELAEVRNRDIGFVFQSFHLLPRLNIVRNVMLPLRYSDIDSDDAHTRAIDMLIRMKLEDRLNHVPNELSSGQRQRVAIARALVNRPKIILADEPTGNLDSKTSGDIMQLFSELHSAGQTIILVTHDAAVAEYAQKVAQVRDGKIEDVQHVQPHR